MREGFTDGSGVRVAVIDSGARTISPRIRGDHGVALLRDPNSEEIVSSSDTLDGIGHGTRCALQILSISPEVEIIPVKVFHSSMETDPTIVEKAIDWATEIGVDILSMSLSTSRRDVVIPWTLACKRAVDRGLILVAAAGSSHSPSYPASFDCVLGVRSAPTAAPREFWFDPAARYQCAARGWPSSIKAPPSNLPGASSLAAATMTGIVAGIIKGIAPADPSALNERLAYLASVPL